MHGMIVADTGLAGVAPAGAACGGRSSWRVGHGADGAGLRKAASLGRHLDGFTLIELLIVLAIIAILTTIALASYDFAIIKANRSSAAGCLLQEAQRMEQWYTTNLTYATAKLPQTAPLSACVQDVQVTDGTYDITGTRAATTFTVIATPKGRQTRDTFCKTLNINQTGLKSVSGTPAPTWPVDRCF